MVDLLSVEKDEDLTFLNKTISDFVAATGSEVGQEVLDKWPASAEKFVKVFPHEYQRALQELKDEEAAANSISVKINGDVVASPNLDIRNAYAIDNTPAVPGMRHVVLPAEAQEPDTDEESDDDDSAQKQPPKKPMMPIKLIAPPPIKVLGVNGHTNGHTNGINGMNGHTNGHTNGF